LSSTQPDDVHDGHGNYLTEVEADLRWISLRRFVDFILASLAGWTVGYWTMLLVGSDGIFGSIAGGFVGFIACLIYVSFIGDLALSTRHRRRLAVSCVVAFLLGVVVPMMYREWAAEAEVRSTRQLREALDQRVALSRRKWLGDLHAAGAHGPPGTEPPMLAIEDAGTRVLVRNIGDRSIKCVRVARHIAARAESVSMSIDGGDCRRLDPGDWTIYELTDADAQYAGEPLEFRIGEPTDPDPSWWTDTALETSFEQEFQVERRDIR
jgi:hypothetical protein